MVSWAGLANFGNSALGGYQNVDNWLAERQQREMQAAAARAYGEAMSKMSQPQPWRVPMANDYTPPPPQMTLPNFMQAMPKGLDPAAMGLAVDRFAPVLRAANMDDYRDQQIRLGAERNQQGWERVQQGAQRIDLANSRIAARDRQNEITNGFRQKEIELKSLGLEQRNPAVLREWERVKLNHVHASRKVDRILNEIGMTERNVYNMKAEDYEASLARNRAELQAAQDELERANDAKEAFDVSGQGLAQPTAPPPAPPRPAPVLVPPRAAVPAPQPTRPPAAPAAPAARPVAPPAQAPGALKAVPPAGAIQYLRDNPQTAPLFEQKYGPGTAKRFLQQSQAAPTGPSGGNLLAGQSAAQRFAFYNNEAARAQQDTRNRAMEKQADEAMQMADGMPGRFNNTRSVRPGAMPAGGAPMDAQPTQVPQGEQTWQTAEAGMQEPAPIAAGSIPARKAADVDALLKQLMISSAEEAGATAGLARATKDAVSDTRKKYAAASGAKGKPNPYIGMSLEQLNGEMKRLAIRQFAAKTPEEDAAVKRDMDLLFAASAESNKRRGEKGS